MEENRIAVAVKALIVWEDRALVLQRSDDDESGPGSWECPGGRMEFGEGLTQALKREVREETGLTVEVEQLLYATDFLPRPHRQLVLLTYRCRPLPPALSVSREAAVILSREHRDFRWADAGELRRLLPGAILQDFDTHGVWSLLHCGKEKAR